MGDIIEAIRTLEAAFDDLNIPPPTIVLQSRSDFGAFVFELGELGQRLPSVKVCTDDQEVMVGRVRVRH